MVTHDLLQLSVTDKQLFWPEQENCLLTSSFTHKAKLQLILAFCGEWNVIFATCSQFGNVSELYTGQRDAYTQHTDRKASVIRR
jgi:hypothetical protein